MPKPKCECGKELFLERVTATYNHYRFNEEGKKSRLFSRAGTNKKMKDNVLWCIHCFNTYKPKQKKFIYSRGEYIGKTLYGEKENAKTKCS